MPYSSSDAQPFALFIQSYIAAEKELSQHFQDIHKQTVYSIFFLSFYYTVSEVPACVKIVLFP